MVKDIWKKVWLTLWLINQTNEITHILVICRMQSQVSKLVMSKSIFSNLNIFKWTLIYIYIYISYIDLKIKICFEPKNMKLAFETIQHLEWIKLSPRPNGYRMASGKGTHRRINGQGARLVRSRGCHSVTGSPAPPHTGNQCNQVS
jgi:hypothetical protein